MVKKSGLFSKLYIALVLLLTYLPIIVVVIYSFNESRYGNWTGFTTDWYAELFKDRQLGASLKNSIQLAVSSTIIAILVGTAGAVGMAKSHFKAQGLLENVSMIPIMIPEIIIGIAYLAFFSFAGVPFGMGTLVAAHATFCIPYVYVNVQSRLVGLDPNYVEAARDLGASPARAFYDITLPLITPSVLSGGLLAFAMSMDDVVISFFVTGPTTNTLPVMVFSMLKMGVTPTINALCTIMLAVVIIAIFLFMLVRKIGSALRNRV
ncbi:MAG: ABC transporter permease [Christensenellales bacterium]|jgi:spermidine/putrescine transport system permease protein